MEVISNKVRNFAYRDQLDRLLALDAYKHKQKFRQVHHYQPDPYFVSGELLVNLAKLTTVFEKFFGGDVQIEFIDGSRGIQVVQVRPLPRTMHDEAEIVEFPDIDEDHAGSAFGVGDIILDVLNPNSDNSEKKGVVIIPNNDAGAAMDMTDKLPEYGAVIILTGGGGRGHFQTLCSREIGLICIYPEVNMIVGRSGQYFDPDSDLKLKKMRVIANGMEGRVYIVNEPDTD